MKEKTLSEKRRELLRNLQELRPQLTMTFGFLFCDIEKQDKEFIKEILDEIENRKLPEDYTSREFKKWIKQIIKQKAGFEELK